MPDLTPGEPAPDFDLPTDGGGRVSLSRLRAQAVVLYFYPKDDTSGCTSQAKGFTEQASEFAQAGAVVVGVSKDSIKSHDRFKAKHALNLILASDEDGVVVERYGVWVEKSMYGRKYMGVERTTVLIDRDGAVRQVWPKVKVPGHVEAVLRAVQSL